MNSPIFSTEGKSQCFPHRRGDWALWVEIVGMDFVFSPQAWGLDSLCTVNDINKLSFPHARRGLVEQYGVTQAAGVGLPHIGGD